MKLLIVSSSTRLTHQLLSALIGEDLTYTEVRTPQRGLALLDEGEKFDLVLGDNDTHPTGGFFLAREIKAREHMGQAMPPVVLLIARREDTYLARWSEADAWVLKPVDPFDLAEVVSSLVERRPVRALPGVWTAARAEELEADRRDALTSSGAQEFVERHDPTASSGGS